MTPELWFALGAVLVMLFFAATYDRKHDKASATD